MCECKDCRYGLPVYKAPEIIDCARTGKIKAPADGCQEGREKDCR